MFQDVKEHFSSFRVEESVLLDYSTICVVGLGFITLRTLLALQASHREVNLLAYSAVVGQKPHICRKSAFRREEIEAHESHSAHTVTDFAKRQLKYNKEKRERTAKLLLSEGFFPP